ncbi:MAG: hypothetical protein HN348_30245, partial [Proteobacteria bacterium]|nr:hypothetical protein [Pseudomonadota bacterium]
MRFSLCWLALFSCDTPPVDDTKPNDTDETPIAFEGPVGGLTVLEAVIDNYDGYRSWTQLWGPYDGAAQDPVWGASWEYLSVNLFTAGDCALEDTFPANFCDPSCDNDQWCAEDGTCIALPDLAPAGKIEVEGLAAPFSMEPTDLGWYLSDDKLPDDVFEPGDEV